MAEAKKYRASDVEFFEADFAPTAKCLGIRIEDDSPQGYEQISECGWEYRPSSGYYGFAPNPGETKKRAKNHALLHPGHCVQVERVTRTSYAIPLTPEQIEDLLKARLRVHATEMMMPVPTCGQSWVAEIASCPRCGQDAAAHRELNSNG